MSDWFKGVGLVDEASLLSKFTVDGATMKQLCKGDGAQGAIALEEIGVKSKIVQAKILGKWDVKREQCQ